MWVKVNPNPPQSSRIKDMQGTSLLRRVHRNRLGRAVVTLCVAAFVGLIGGHSVVSANQIGVNPLTGERFSPERLRDIQDKVKAAIESLTEEADRLMPDSKQDMEGAAGSVRFQQRRPHAAIAPLSPDMGLIVLREMTQDFTGDPHADTYVRYHLIPIVERMINAHFRRVVFEGNREAKMPDLVADQLERLIRAAPLDGKPGMSVQRIREPADLWAEWQRLNASTRITVGTPPFERRLQGREALRFAEGQKKEQIRRALDRMAEIGPKIKTQEDVLAQRYNSRVGDFNEAARVYLGDLLSALVASGSDETFSLFTSTIDRLLADNNQYIAYDLLDVFYAAVFRGHLRLYSDREIEDFKRRLDRLSAKYSEYRDVYQGDNPVRFTLQGRRDLRRSFYDASFHLRRLLEEPVILDQFVIRNRQGLAADRLNVEDRVRGGVTPESLNAADVKASIRWAINAINVEYPSTREGLHPRLGMTPWQSNQNIASRVVDLRHFDTGYHALASWAMLAAGESSQDPRLFERINFVLRGDPLQTFERAMRLQSVQYLPRNRYLPWLERDAQWLLGAMVKEPPLVGTFPRVFTDENKIPGDNVQAFFGVLGLAAAQEAGYRGIDNSIWEMVDYHWRAVQQRTAGDNAAGWARGFYNLDTGPYRRLDSDLRGRLAARGGPDPFVTAAGSYAIDTAERFLGRPGERDNFQGPPGSEGRELAKGIAWLNENFSLTGDVVDFEFYYRMWLMQRLGLATGRRSFNGIDWVRDITTEIINRQRDDGLWRENNISRHAGEQIPATVPTGMSLLYLSSSLQPAAISKIELDNNGWNNHPSDLRNFVEYASDVYEVQTGWQIIEPDAKLVELQDTPLLFITTDRAFELSEQEVRQIRRFVDAGGLLVTNAEKGQSEVRAFLQLYRSLFPDTIADARNNLPLAKASHEHEIFNMHQKVRGLNNVLVVENGVRTLAVHFPRDISADLHENRRLRSPSFPVLSNLYLYAVGQNPRQERLVNRIITPRPDVPVRDQLTAARVKHQGSFDPEPFFQSQLVGAARNELGIGLSIQTVEPGELGDVDVAFLTTTGDNSDPLTDAQASAIRDYLQRGGTLWLDAASGSTAAVQAARAVAQDILPDARIAPLPGDSRIITGILDNKGRLVRGFDNYRIRYRAFALQKMKPTSRPRLQAVFLGDRPAIIFSEEDITAGVAGLRHWGIFGYDVPSSRQLVLNGLLDIAEQEED